MPSTYEMYGAPTDIAKAIGVIVAGLGELVTALEHERLERQRIENEIVTLNGRLHQANIP